MSYTADNRKIAADPGVYPQIRNRQDMEACLCGMEVVEEIVSRFNRRGVHFGEAKNVTGDVARQILINRL